MYVWDGCFLMMYTWSVYGVILIGGDSDVDVVNTTKSLYALEGIVVTFWIDYILVDGSIEDYY